MQQSIRLAGPGVYRHPASHPVRGDLQDLDAQHIAHVPCPPLLHFCHDACTFEGENYHTLEHPSTKPRLLLVEDDASLRRMLKLNLERSGWHVTEATNGTEGLQAFRQARFDVGVLDVMLPGMDGITLCKTIRLEGQQVPILFLTAKNTSEDRIEGLRSGGDDYLGKPFHLEELLLRVKRMAQRAGHAPDDGQMAADALTHATFGERCAVDFLTYEVTTHDGIVRSISKREALLLKLLISRAGEVVSREEILEVVWGYQVFPSTRTIDNFILGFRKYFEPDPRQPRHFFSVRGVGYRFCA